MASTTANMAAIKLIVGLGNPGASYSGNRHNVGFMFVDQVAATQQLELRAHTRWRGQYALMRHPEGTAHLLKPTTYMNLSGQAVAACARYFKIAPEQILVAHDEIDFPQARLRLKFAGGSGGHNGLKDIISHLGSNNFWRLRIGVDRPANKDEVKNYVLSDFSSAELPLIQSQLERTQDELNLLLKGQTQRAQQKIAALDN